MKPPSQTIHCICLLLNNDIVPNTLYLSSSLFCTLETKPGLLGGLDSTTRPRYAVSSEAELMTFDMVMMIMGWPMTVLTVSYYIYKKFKKISYEIFRKPTVTSHTG